MAWSVIFAVLVVLESLLVACVDAISPFGIGSVGGTAVSTYPKAGIPRM